MMTADVAPGHALDEASADIRKMFAGLNMPATMSYRLQGQSQILDETTTNLIMAIALAMIFVYMVLASQFESFIQPIVIMLVLPISVPFAMFTLWVDGPHAESLERARHAAAARHREEELDPAGGLRQHAAQRRACRCARRSCRRAARGLRPILMTTLAIIAGLIPTALGIGIGGTGRSAIAVTVVGGQSLCLFLTLLLVPVAYVKFDALEQTALNQGWRGLLGPLQNAATTHSRRPRLGQAERPRRPHHEVTKATKVTNRSFARKSFVLFMFFVSS